MGRMTMTIEDLLEYKAGDYIAHETCAGCDSVFITFAPIDAGADYHAFMLPTCEICVAALGGHLLDEPTDDERETIIAAHSNGVRVPYDEDLHGQYDDWNSDDEKWGNYWGDFNQCGVRVEY